MNDLPVDLSTGPNAGTMGRQYLSFCPCPQVQDWLRGLFAGEEVPAYEINSQTVGVLYELATSSRRKADLAKIAIEDMQQKTTEYLAEGK